MYPCSLFLKHAALNGLFNVPQHVPVNINGKYLKLVKHGLFFKSHNRGHRWARFWRRGEVSRGMVRNGQIYISRMAAKCEIVFDL